MMAANMDDRQIRYLRNQKYRNLHKPYQEFIFYKNFMLIAHGNILSYYDMEDEEWKCHHKFEEQQSQDEHKVSLN